MYFLPRSNTFIARIIMVKPLHLYALTIMIVACIISAWFFGFYAPLTNMIEQQRHQIEQARDQSSRMSSLGQLHNTLVSSTQQATSAFDSYRSDNDVHGGMLSLMNQADLLALTINGFSADSSEDKGWYTRQGLTLDMSGSYAKLINFLHTCVESDYLLQVKRSELTHIADGIFHLKAHIDLIALK